MDFTSRLNTTARTALDTSIGYCDTPNGRIDCVRKQYGWTDFGKIAGNYRKHRHIIEKYGPKVYSIDDDSRSVIIEFIPGKTFKDVVMKEINPWEKEGLDTLKVLINNAHKALNELHNAGFCHDDAHGGNLMVLDNLEVRLIDFDGLRLIGERIVDVDNPDGCDDTFLFAGELEDDLRENIRIRKELSDAKFEAQERSIKQLLEAADPEGNFFYSLG